MITPEEFPYIKSLYVNDCYAYKDFNIELHDYKPFSHLILTGKNGSGKSTILLVVNRHILTFRGQHGGTLELSNPISRISWLKEVIADRLERYGVEDLISYERQKELEELERVIPIHAGKEDTTWPRNEANTIYSYFPAKRSSNVDEVEAPSKEKEFAEKLNAPDSTDYFIRKFKQYLVNQKVEQAFSQIEHQTAQIEQVDLFFNQLQRTLRKLLEDSLAQIEFVRNSYEFYIKLSSGRRITFDVLPEGLSAILSVLMDLFTRVDLIRKQVGDYSYNPCGIVLIDEPETHLHLQLQEQVLPLLTSLFPNIQFIAATHSPAVIASIKNATIFDLTTKETRISEEAVGRSYSDLMRGHFGLNNEYSGLADELFRKVDKILKENKNRPDELKTKLQQFFVENEAYLSPSFRVELESMILENA